MQKPWILVLGVIGLTLVMAIAAPAQTSEEIAPDQVRFIQGLLGVLGYYQGTIDGTFSAATLRAMSRYAHAKGVGGRWMTDKRIAKALGEQLVIDFLTYAATVGWLTQTTPPPPPSRHLQQKDKGNKNISMDKSRY